MRLLVVVDMQNDFVNGVLGFPEANKIIAPIEKKIQEYLDNKDRVLFTLDTHYSDYSDTREGKHLPIEHCIYETEGHKIIDELQPYLNQSYVCEKTNSFGIDDFHFKYCCKQGRQPNPEISWIFNVNEIEIVGLVSNLCVLSCAVSLQTMFPFVEITIDANCTSSPNKDLHEKALDIMEGLQINVINR